jgi:flagellar biogenesis protein FliO
VSAAPATRFRLTATARANAAVLLAIVLTFLTTATTAAQATKSAPTPTAVPMPVSEYAAQAIRRASPARNIPPAPGDTTDSPTDTAPTAPASGFSTFRVLLSLGLVVAMIFAMKFLGQRFFVPGGVVGRGASRTVEMLSRSTIGPKQQVLLIRIGKRRVLVVGDSGGKLAALDQITDADEIAELTTQLVTEKSAVAPNAFASLFGRSAEKYQEEAVDPEERKGLLIDDELVDSNVNSTQQELQGLLAKVRKVSNKLGSS